MATKEAAVQEFDLGKITDFVSAEAALRAAGIEVQSVAEFGDGTVLITSKEKAKLVNVPFMILDATFRVDKETNRDYVSLVIVTKDAIMVDGYPVPANKLIVNDGSVGLFEQCARIQSERGSLIGLAALGGLSGGEYTTEVNGETVKASTFYLAGM